MEVAGLSDAYEHSRFALGRAYPSDYSADNCRTSLSQKQKALSGMPERALLRSKLVNSLVCAARKQGNQHHQVGQGKQPLVCLFACRFRSARDKAQMAAFRKIANVIHADTSQAGNFRVGKNLLTRFYGDHGLVPLTVCHTARLVLAPVTFDAFFSVRDAPFAEQ